MHILGLSYKELKEYLIGQSFPEYRTQQVWDWLYKKLVEDGEKMTNLPKELRHKLAQDFSFQSLPIVKEQTAKAESVKKYTFQLFDGNYTIAVKIPDKDGYTACISAQVGCLLNCAFCATAKMEYQRNLFTWELIAQVLNLCQNEGRMNHLVFMGLGEPLLNYPAVIKALKILTHSKGFNMGQRRITLSSAGVVPEIYRFANEQTQINLAISLNASNQSTRAHLMPIARVYSLTQLLAAVDYYINKTNRQVTFEYVLLKGINDSQEDVNRLINMLKGRLVCLNIIPYNKVPGLPFESPERKNIDSFKRNLQKGGVVVTERKSRGNKIDAACGQLRT